MICVIVWANICNCTGLYKSPNPQGINVYFIIGWGGEEGEKVKFPPLLCHHYCVRPNQVKNINIVRYAQ